MIFDVLLKDEERKAFSINITEFYTADKITPKCIQEMNLFSKKTMQYPVPTVQFFATGKDMRFPTFTSMQEDISLEDYLKVRFGVNYSGCKNKSYSKLVVD